MSNQNICNICGASYVYVGGRWKCPACGAFKAEELSNEEVTLLYNAAQKLRLCNFDEAEIEYSDIIEKFPKNPEGYWGRLLARYGIKYEEDFDGRKVPTCYAASIKSVFGDPDYEKAMSLFGEDEKAYYKSQAEYIERVRREWIEKASKEPPYDIFLCYKDSDLENGVDRTADSFAVQELYIHLTEQGYRVFYSRESLRDKVGEKYEPYIFNALSTAKVMLVYGSKPEYITSTWLKNEWTRYIKRIQSGEKQANSLLVACDGFTPDKLPKALSSTQCFDANKRSFYSDLDKVIKKALAPKETQNSTEREEQNTDKKPKKKIGKKIIVISLAVIVCFAVLGMILDIFDGKETSSVEIPEHSITVTAKENIFNKNTTVTANKYTSGSKYISLVSAVEAAEDLTVKVATVYDINCTEELTKEFTVSIAYTKVNADNEIKVFYVSDDLSTVTEHYCFFENGVVSFKTNHLSYYIIVEISVSNTNQGGNDSENGDNQNPDNNQGESGSNACAHDETEIIPGYAASCKATGLTDGEKCKKCGETLVSQTVISKINHIESGWIIDKAATSEDNGKKHTECTVCHEKIKEETIPATGSLGLAYSINGQNCIITGIGTCTDTKVVIPEKINGIAVTKIDSWAFNNCKNLLTIEIPDSVTSIGSYAFYGCASLESIDIPDSVTNIDSYAFENCTSLESVVIGDGVKTIDSSAFQSCSALKNLEIGNSVTIIGERAFKACTSLKNIVIPGSVTSIEARAFYECTALVSIELPDSVASIGESAFYECISLESILLPDNITSIEKYTFYKCLSLKSIEIPDSVTTVNSFVFDGCSALESIKIPDSVTSIGTYAFSDCSALKSIALSESITNIGDGLFKGCSSLKNLVIPDSVTKVGFYAFNNCSALKDVYYKGSQTEWAKITLNSSGNSYLTSATRYYYSETEPTTDGNFWYYDADGTVEIWEIDSSTSYSVGLAYTSNGDGTCSVSGIGTCTDTEVVIPSIIDGLTVTSIGQFAFSGCSALESIVIPDSVTSIGVWAFYCCTSLESIVIPDSVTSIGSYAFSGYSSLANVYYTGSEEEWAAINIAPSNEYLTNIAIHYNFVFEE